MTRHHSNCTGRNTQGGVSLIEVMIAILISAIGLLGAAAMQVNALKYTDSAFYTSQASFIAYDILDRIRAHGDTSDYALADLTAVPAADGSNVVNTDLNDLANNMATLPGPAAAITVDANGTTVTVTIGWSEAKIGANDLGSFVVTTDVF